MSNGAAAPPGPAFNVGYLRARAGSLGTNDIVLLKTRPSRIGRDESNDLQFFDAAISRFHARVDFNPTARMHVAEGADLTRASVVHARTLHVPVHQAVSRRTRGVALVHTGDVVQGRSHLEAAAAFERMCARIDRAKTLLALAELDSRADYLINSRTLCARLQQDVDLATQLRLDPHREVALNLSARLSN